MARASRPRSRRSRTKNSVRHGDTGLSPFGMGTIASRSIVMAGGAVAHTSRLLREKILKIGAHLLQCDPADVRCAGGKIVGRSGAVGMDEVARVAHLRMEALPPGVEPLLNVTSTYQPGIDTGVYSYATHAAVVAVDPATGMIELLDFAVAEDCGTMINPMIVEGGAIAPPAAIANAVRDALRSLGAEVNETPLTPRRVLAAIRKAAAGTVRDARVDAE